MPLVIAFLLNIFTPLLPPLRRLLSHSPSSFVSIEPKYEARLGHVDVGRGVGIIAVLIIHLTLILAGHYNGIARALDTVGSIMRFAVPFFLVFSAASLTYDSKNIGKFFKPKIWRVGVPYVCTVVFYCFLTHRPLSSVPLLLITGDAAPQFYFIPLLFQFYLLTPFLMRVAHIKYFLIYSLITSILFFYVLRASQILGVTNSFSYLFYFAYGLSYSARIRQGESAIAFKTGVFLSSIFILSFCFFPGRYGNDQFIYSILILEVFLHSMRILPFRATLAWMGRNSLWIFLFHWWVFLALEILLLKGPLQSAPF